VSGHGEDTVVQAYGAEPLRPGVVVPSLTAPNVIDQIAVATALRNVLSQLGTRPRRVALIIPDVAAKLSLIRFDQVPARSEDFEQLVRWQVRKSAPFAVDDACVSYTPGVRGADGSSEFLVLLARRDIIRGYEQACDAAGIYAGLVDLATLSILNLCIATPGVATGDWLTVHMRPDYTSIAIMRGENVIFYRNRLEGEGETLADLVHQTAMYYEDRLSGTRFARALLSGSGRTVDGIDVARRGLEQRLGVPVEPTRVATLTDRVRVTTDVMDILAPLVGMMLRTRLDTVQV
jgi:Tfp pilus assembly PilM family ATPase